MVKKNRPAYHFKVFSENRLLDFLSQQKKIIIPHTRIQSWLNEIEQGRFQVNNYFIGKNYWLKKDTQLSYYHQNFPVEPKVNDKVKILYQDEQLLIVNKPAPLPAHPCGSYFQNTLKNLLKKQGNYFSLNRLDNETSGIVFFAKNRNSIHLLTKAFLKSQKYYLVLVYGKIPSSLRVDIPLGRLTNCLVHKKRGHRLDGKPSTTLFRRIAFKNQKSLVLAFPQTGRTHQIRAHLLEKGFPIVGDKIYGKNEKFFLEFLEKGLTTKLLQKLEIKRHFLHNYQNIFFHPFIKKRLVFKVDLPIDLKRELKKNNFNLPKI